MDGPFYRDLRTPHATSDFTSVAPAATATTLWPVGAASPTILPANYWWDGKTVKLTANLRWTTGASGNISVGMSYGAASNPAVIVTSTAVAKIASVGPFDVFMEGYARCRSLATQGTAATLSMWGRATFPLGLILSTVGQIHTFPANGTTVVSTFDNTLATQALMFHALVSAGTDGVVCTDVFMEALN